MILKTLFIALAGAAAWKLAGGSRSRHKPSASKPKAMAENRWQVEGGALRDRGAQPKPARSRKATPA